jgi:hypothetical protein
MNLKFEDYRPRYRCLLLPSKDNDGAAKSLRFWSVFGKTQLRKLADLFDLR